MCGWRKPGTPAPPRSSSSTRWPWCGSGPGTGMPRWRRAPTRRSAPRPSASAAPGPTSRASCTGSTRPSRTHAEPRLLLLIEVRELSVVYIGVGFLGVFLGLFPGVGLGQIVDDNAVQFLVTLPRVGLALGVQGGGAAEPFPRLVLA